MTHLPLRLIDPPARGEPEELPSGGWQRRPRAYRVGDAWFATEHKGSFYAYPGPLYPPRSLPLAESYHRELATIRAPLMVVLPGPVVCCLDVPGCGWRLVEGAPGLVLEPIPDAAAAVA